MPHTCVFFQAGQNDCLQCTSPKSVCECPMDRHHEAHQAPAAPAGTLLIQTHHAELAGCVKAIFGVLIINAGDNPRDDLHT